MKSYLSVICGVLLVGALCAVLAAPSSESSDSSDSSDSSSSSISLSKEKLSFPKYTVFPRSSEILTEDLNEDLDISELSSDETDSEEPQGRTFLLLLRLLQLLSQSNSTLIG